LIPQIPGVALPESVRFPAALAAAILLPVLLGACAAGSSMSLATAPLSYVVDDQGGRDVAARDDGTAEALAERSGTTNVTGLEALGGNALLPVSVRLTAGQGAASLNAALPGIAANAALTPLAPPAATLAIAPAGTPLPVPVDRVLVTAGPLLGTVKTAVIKPLATAINADNGLLAAVGTTLRLRH
jgi:hypothetical protein